MTVEIISWSISTKVWDRAGIELATPGIAVRHASVARHVTEQASVAINNYYNSNRTVDSEREFGVGGGLNTKLSSCTNSRCVFISLSYWYVGSEKWFLSRNDIVTLDLRENKLCLTGSQ